MIPKQHLFTFMTNIYSYTDNFRQTRQLSVGLMGALSLYESLYRCLFDVISLMTSRKIN
jgi:hypothetical protein